ncbi:MAG: glycosyltransferase family 2 protein [Anaerolineae bacterium]|nr:glycosyltransferase family 2 protein [Anaerolineae bacterium]
MNNLSVVVVNYNTREDLRACLHALRGSSLQPEIIVVDNASSDDSAAMVRSEFGEVKLIAPGRNTWYCGGNNLGVAAAEKDYVLLLNPDTVVQPDALAVMLTFLEMHSDYAGVTMQLRYPDGAIQRTCSRRLTLEYLLLTHTVLGWLLPGARRTAEAAHWYAGWERDRDYDVETMPGSCTLMRRNDLEYDEDLLLYFPEDDLARRFTGRKFRFLASTYITHREKSATRSWHAIEIYYRDLMVFMRKHFGQPARLVLWLLSRPLYWGMALRWRIKPPGDQRTRRSTT